MTWNKNLPPQHIQNKEKMWTMQFLRACRGHSWFVFKTSVDGMNVNSLWAIGNVDFLNLQWRVIALLFLQYLWSYTGNASSTTYWTLKGYWLLTGRTKRRMHMFNDCDLQTLEHVSANKNINDRPRNISPGLYHQKPHFKKSSPNSQSNRCLLMAGHWNSRYWLDDYKSPHIPKPDCITHHQQSSGQTPNSSSWGSPRVLMIYAPKVLEHASPVFHQVCDNVCHRLSVE